MPKYILLQEIGSTNDYLKRTAAMMTSGTVIQAYTQSAGRGQKGNSWESESGKNATFSMLIKQPRVDVKEQFFLSEAVSLAIVDALEPFVEGLKIKWPNDIYYGDHKLSGILIENSLGDKCIDYMIAGIGVNLNQQVFTSGAPNPVSLTNITGKVYNIEEVTYRICENIERYCEFDGSREQLIALHKRYLEKLYRYDGQPHPFMLPNGTPFRATIEAVAPDGLLTLRHAIDNALHDYYFKEVEFVINKGRYLRSNP